MASGSALSADDDLEVDNVDADGLDMDDVDVDDLAVVGVVCLEVTEVDWPAGAATVMAASVTIVRGAPDEGSVKLTIIIPTAAT